MVKRIFIAILLLFIVWITYKVITHKPEEYVKVDASMYGFWIPEKIEWECDSDTVIMDKDYISNNCGSSFYYYYIDSNCIVKLWSAVNHDLIVDSMTIGVDGSCKEIYKSDTFSIHKMSDTIVNINKSLFVKTNKFDSYSLKEGINCSCISR